MNTDNIAVGYQIAAIRKERTARRSVPTKPLHIEEKIIVGICAFAMGTCVAAWVFGPWVGK